MPSAVSVAGEVASAAATLAGLILVFIGAQAASYGTFDRTAQNAVRGGFQRRAWFAFVGFALCLVAVTAAIGGKWFGSPCMAAISAILLAAAIIWVLFAALLTVLEIK